MSFFLHQRHGADWLASRRRAYLGDVPGLGKTRTAILALQRVQTHKALVVCPAIVRSHWAREIQTVIGRPAIPGMIRSYDEIMRGGNALMKTLIQGEGVTALVLDEAHALRHASAKRTMMLLGPDGYARRMEYVYALSGTPMPKHPGEFWTLLSSLFPHVAVEHGLRTYADVLDRFCVTRGSYMRGAWRTKVLPIVRNEEEFKAILSTVMLRRTLDDVGIDVPALHWQTTRLDPDAHDLLTGELDIGTMDLVEKAAFWDGALAEIEQDPHVARMRRRLGELKVLPVAEMLAGELRDSTEKVVVFAHHTTVLHALRAFLAPFGVCYVDGSTTRRAADLAIEQFQTNPERRVFLGQNIACKEGITLTAARRVVLVEPDWSAYVNEQLGKRIARIGQTGHCVGQMICLAGTLDEAIIAQNLREVQMADSVDLGSKRAC